MGALRKTSPACPAPSTMPPSSHLWANYAQCGCNSSSTTFSNQLHPTSANAYGIVAISPPCQNPSATSSLVSSLSSPMIYTMGPGNDPLACSSLATTQSSPPPTHPPTPSADGPTGTTSTTCGVFQSRTCRQRASLPLWVGTTCTTFKKPTLTPNNSTSTFLNSWHSSSKSGSQSDNFSRTTSAPPKPNVK